MTAGTEIVFSRWRNVAIGLQYTIIPGGLTALNFSYWLPLLTTP